LKAVHHAYKYHNPDKKPRVCVQLPGTQGTGKSLLCEILCNALFGSDDDGGTFVQLDGTKKEQLLEKYNAHLSRTDVILVDELSKEVTPKNIYEMMKKSITDEKIMIRRMREAYAPERSHMLWILTTNHEYAIEIDDPSDRRHVIISCDDGYLHLPNPPEFHNKCTTRDVLLDPHKRKFDRHWSRRRSSRKCFSDSSGKQNSRIHSLVDVCLSKRQRSQPRASRSSQP